jgi:Tfp pilus assembly protein PilV
MQVCNLKRRQLGQGMTEYIIVVALIAVAAIAVYQLFGQVVRSQTAAMARELAGEDGSTQSKAASTAASTAAEQTKSRSLQSFTGNAKAAK